MAEKDLGDGLEAFENEVEELKNKKMKIFGITMTPTTIGALFALLGAIGGCEVVARILHTDICHSL